jgi:thioredoxin-like negative regulator of GroEL
VKAEDGPGRPLGRSFRVKLWPTVVVMKDGQEVARVVRPADAKELKDALDQAGRRRMSAPSRKRCAPPPTVRRPSCSPA